MMVLERYQVEAGNSKVCVRASAHALTVSHLGTHSILVPPTIWPPALQFS